jgi:hypothetical protein
MFYGYLLQERAHSTCPRDLLATQQANRGERFLDIEWKGLLNGPPFQHDSHEGKRDGEDLFFVSS